MTALKSCPSCGGQPRWYALPHVPMDVHREELRCSVCKRYSGGICEAGSIPGRARVEAQWNTRDALPLDSYDAGLINTHGGGETEWWLSYIRALLNDAHEHYQAQVDAA